MITLPESLTEICEGTFLNCTLLKNIILPDGITKIGSRAFSGCISLKNIILPEGVIDIESYAFSWCVSLERVRLPDSVAKICNDSFYGCKNLDKIDASEGNSVFTSVDGVLYDKSLSVVIMIPKKKTCVSLPDSVTDIGKTFTRCSSLVSITLPKGVKQISKSAFGECKSLKSITLPEGVEEIGKYAFLGCESLESVTLPDSVAKIRHDSFQVCESLDRIDVSEDNSVFASVDGILYDKTLSIVIKVPEKKTSVTLLDSVTEIGINAFKGCKLLESITLPKNVTKIGKEAFEYCTSLKSITLFDGVTEIGGRVFRHCDSVKRLTIHGSTGSITVDYPANYRPNLRGIMPMLKSGDYNMDIALPVKYALVAEVYKQTAQPEAEAFIHENIEKVMEHFIDLDNFELVQFLLESGKFVTDENILNFIEYAIDHTQQGGDVQIQVLLTDYRITHFPQLDTTPLI